MEEPGVNELIRAKILAGRLPPCEGFRLFGGAGDGAPCACCDRIISASELEFEVECPVGAKATLPMHLHCFEAWRALARSAPVEALGRSGEEAAPAPQPPTGGP